MSPIHRSGQPVRTEWLDEEILPKLTPSPQVESPAGPKWTGVLGPDGRHLARKREEIGFLPRREFATSKHNQGLGWTGKLEAFLTWDRVKHG